MDTLISKVNVDLALALLGGGVGIFLYFHLAPVLALRIIPIWSGKDRQFLTLRFEVENKSRVRINKPKIFIQVLKHEIADKEYLSEWIPFDSTGIRPRELPVVWREPEEVFKAPPRIFPGEVVTMERLYHFPQQTLILHVGLQVKVKMSWFGLLVSRKIQPWSQTMACFVSKDS